jgi:DNA-binding transcriptional LysR family regulator
MKVTPFSQLQVFLAVARLRSFSAAARELGVTRSAVSQAVRQLEEQLRVVLLARTTRSVSPTDAGRRLLEAAGPGFSEVLGALANASAQPGEPVGRLRLTVPNISVPFVINPVLPTFRERYPRIEVEVVVEDRFVDIVAKGFDAGVRSSEAIEQDMVQVRLTDSFRYVVVAAPSYLERHGTPQKPQDLLRHECINARAESTGDLYAWELERGRKNWRIPVRGGAITNSVPVMVALAESGAGLMYAFESDVKEQLRDGRLKIVLEAYASIAPGFFLYFPSRAQRSEPLRLFVEAARELTQRRAR